MLFKNVFGLALAFSALAFTTGCGASNNANHVEGRVTIDGNPLAGATVVFARADGGADGASGITNADGVYTLFRLQGGDAGEGASVGDYLVTVTKAAVGADNSAATGSSDSMPDPRATVVAKSEVPTRYNNPQTSGFTATVKSGKNIDVNFDLTSK